MSKENVLGEQIDGLWDLKEKIAAKQLQLEKTKTYQLIQEMKDEASNWEDELMSRYDEEELRGALGKNARLILEVVETWSPYNWEKFTAYVKKHDAWDLLHKRAATRAVRDRTEDGKKIPGLSKTTKRRMRIKPI